MSHPKSKPTDWAALLQCELKKISKEPAGPGWETFEEIMKRTGWCESKTRTCLRSAIRSRGVEKFSGSRTNEDGRCYNCTWYRQIK